MTLTESILVVAPLFNALLALLVLITFLIFMRKKRKAEALPWKLIFTAALILFVDQILTLGQNAWWNSPLILFGFLDLLVATLFVYTLLIQLERF
jgi:hypothetical protein